MDICQIKLFVSIVQLKTISRAALKMNITQSAASQSLAKLESELGCRLFVRHKRGLDLGQEGKLFYPHALNILKELDLAQQELDENDSQISGLLHLRVYAASALIPQLIFNFHQDYPNVQISMNQQMDAEDFDLCITTGEFGSLPSGAQRLYDEEVMLAVPANHPKFIGVDTVTPKDIANENLIITRAGSSLRIMANRLFRQAGIEPRIFFEADNPSVVRELITMGLGVSLFPRISWQNIADDSIRLLHVAEPSLSRTLYIYSPAHRITTNTIRAFQNYALRYFEDRQNKIIQEGA